MSKWSITIDDYLKETDPNTKEHSLETFFINKTYIPETDEEKKTFEEFSLVSSSMALTLVLAKSKGFISPAVKKEIITELVFQLHQRPLEYERYKSVYGKSEEEIISHLFDKLLADFETQNVDIDHQIDMINLVYKNNPQKRFYVIRLLFFVAFADHVFQFDEASIINRFADKLNVDKTEVERIKNEVIKEINFKMEIK